MESTAQPPNTLLILDFDRTLFNLDRFLADEQKGEVGKDYLFDDATKLLKNLPTDVQPIVVSQATMPKVDNKTGVDWQYHKHEYAPALAKLPFYVTEANKGHELARSIMREAGAIAVNLRDTTGAFERVILVDDNASAFKPLLEADAPIEMYHLARPGEKYAELPSPTEVIRIASMSEIRI